MLNQVGFVSSAAPINYQNANSPVTASGFRNHHKGTSNNVGSRAQQLPTPPELVALDAINSGDVKWASAESKSDHTKLDTEHSRGKRAATPTPEACEMARIASTFPGNGRTFTKTLNACKDAEKIPSGRQHHHHEVPPAKMQGRRVLHMTPADCRQLDTHLKHKPGDANSLKPKTEACVEVRRQEQARRTHERYRHIGLG